MRKRAKVDANQPEIVEALRKCGCTVLHLHAVGGGCPDILVGFRKVNVLVEIKDGSKPPSKRNLTPDQEDFFASWRGQASVVSSVAEAMELVGVYGDSVAGPAPEIFNGRVTK